MYKLQLDREFSQDLFSESSKEIRDWVVNAIANIVVADDIIEKHEFVALQEAMGLLDSKEEIIDLMKKVKERNLFEVKKIKMDPDLALKFFFYLFLVFLLSHISSFINSFREEGDRVSNSSYAFYIVRIEENLIASSHESRVFIFSVHR